MCSSDLRDPTATAGVVAELRRLGPGAFLILPATEARFIRQTASFPPTWERKIRAAMAAEPGVRQVVNNPDAAVFQARHPVVTHRPAPNLHVAPPVQPSTIWTPIGLLALAGAVLLLGARELVRVAMPGRRSLMRPLALAASPAVLLLLIAVIERFRVIS